MVEEWRDIPGYEGIYQASSLGRVRSVDRWVESRPGVGYWKKGSIKTATKWGAGYFTLSLYRSGRQKTATVHELVAAAFIGPRPPGMDVCHNDGDKENNLASNLRYDTRSANIVDEVSSGRHHMASKAFCKNAHKFSEENTLIGFSANGRRRRSCRACAKEAQKRLAARRASVYSNEHQTEGGQE